MIRLFNGTAARFPVPSFYYYFNASCYNHELDESIWANHFALIKRRV